VGSNPAARIKAEGREESGERRYEDCSVSHERFLPLLVMAHQTRWSDLPLGIIAACVILLAALATLVYARVGSLHGKTFTLYLTTDAARGVASGTEVWLDGQKVGLVKSVGFRPPSVDPHQRVVLSLDVLESARKQIRQDTHAQIRSGASLIGDQVIALSSGTSGVGGVVSGDTIRSDPQTDVQTLTGDASAAAKSLPGILANVRMLASQLHSARSTVGAFTTEGGGVQLERVHAKSSRVLGRLTGAGTSRGTLGLVRSGVLQERAGHAMAEVDSIRALLGSNQHSLGRFRRDSTLVGVVDRVRGELADLQRLANSPRGTIGRARTDTAITANIDRARASMDSLFADLKQHPLRYIVF
jgi:phospholipid/cholesterol/gamma-HCH transport system substrate-binding protein